MSYYFVHCSPTEAHAVGNVRVFGAGRIQIVFSNSDGEHADISKELDADMAKGVIADLRASAAYIKLERTLGALAEAKRQLAELNADAQIDKLAAKRNAIISEVPREMAKKLQAVDQSLAGLSGTVQGMRDSIALLDTSVNTLRHECETIAGTLSEHYMNVAFARLAEREIAASKALSDKAGALVADLVKVKNMQQQAAKYAQVEFGRVFVDAALTTAK